VSKKALPIFLTGLVLLTQQLPVFSQENRRDAALPDIQNRETTTLPIPFDSTSITGQALNLILNKKIEEARALLLKTYAEQKRNGKIDPDIPYFLGAIEAHNERYSSAIKHLNETQSLLEKSGKPDMRSQMLITKRIGDCHYKNHDLKPALSAYNTALFLTQKQNNIPPILISEITESIVGCETYLKDYEAAEKHCRALIESTRAQVNGGGIPAVLNYSWSMLQLSEILKKAGKKKEFEAAQADAFKLMSQIMMIRATLESVAQIPDYEQLAQVFRLSYVQALAPQSPAEIAWAGNDFRIRTLPVISWHPKTKPIAAVICIHGLGLENRAFSHTAKRLVERGYLVGAIDVRGFGAWVQTRGEEELDYDQCLVDIEDVVRIVKKKNPNIPVFVLGESMGGAIAVRAAAKLGSQINGVISSVPSAERFQEKRMSLQTAMHFIIDPKRTFDVGDFVAERATSSQSEREKWIKDPTARLDLSPIELMKFSLFMRTTKRHAEQIKDVPVLMLQGLKDRLVKPKGTFDLFEAVGCEDKSIVVLGLSEHLMFENPSPDETVIDTVDSWLRNHFDTSAKKPPATTSTQDTDNSPKD
jgi:lysophospholipase